MAKTIKNTETNLLLSEDVKLKYSDLIATVVNQPIKEGITLKQMKSDLAILTKLENVEADADIEFTDSQIKTIRNATQSHLWGIRHPEIDTFGDVVEKVYVEIFGEDPEG